MKDLWSKIKRKWVKLRLQPIRVFCLHHVSTKFDAESMNECDWIQIEEFKTRIISMLNGGVKFISLLDAYTHIKNDRLRHNKYAVLTFDDGYASLNEILPWLAEQKIPVTLFINGKYLDGISYRKNPKEQYLTKEDMFALTSPLIEIGSHGWEHTDASQLSVNEFAESMGLNVKVLDKHPRYIPFHAYTWGAHSGTSDRVLRARKIIPVLMDGAMNYNDQLVIHRELLDK